MGLLPVWLLQILIFSNAVGYDCEQWFQNQKIKRVAGCIDRCQAMGLGPEQIHAQCAAHCTDLCKGSVNKDNSSQPPKSIVTRPLIYYPGLTSAEKKLIQENPTEAFKVYLQKNAAEEAAQKKFPLGLRNDESDA
jgi:hypothetical protein